MTQVPVIQIIRKAKAPDFFPGPEFSSRNGSILAGNSGFEPLRRICCNESLLTDLLQITKWKQRSGLFRRPID
jgi:hypothetical protein